MPEDEQQPPSKGCAEHDWRVNPHINLASYPPSQHLVCALCGAQATRRTPGFKPKSNDPKDWPKA